jgi:hypothetical protein
MDQEYEKELEEIVNGMKCPRDFKCYKSGFDALCKARYFGLDSFLLCEEEDSTACKFTFRLGRTFYCQCPLRKYIAKRLKK